MRKTDRGAPHERTHQEVFVDNPALMRAAADYLERKGFAVAKALIS